MTEKIVGDQYAFPLMTTTHEQGFAWWNGAFDALQLDQLIALFEEFPEKEATLAGGDTNPVTRRSKISWIPYLADGPVATKWVYDIITNVFKEVNAQHYGYDLHGIEQMQYTRYAEDYQGHYNWHIDKLGKGRTAQRKLTMVMQLSHPFDYDGGDLAAWGAAEQVCSKERGIMHFFPSYTLHRVTPVTKGLRKSLVAWAYGPQFK